MLAGRLIHYIEPSPHIETNNYGDSYKPMTEIIQSLVVKTSRSGV